MAVMATIGGSDPAEGREQFRRWYRSNPETPALDRTAEACKTFNRRLRQMKLTTEDIDLLAGGSGSDVVVERIRLVEQEFAVRTSQSKKLQRVSKMANAFCDVANRIAPIVQLMVPQSPEYAIPMGCLTLLFKTVAYKNEKEEAFVEQVTRLADNLPMADFYRDVFPTSQMIATVASVYMNMLSFLEHALAYYCLGSLSKLIDALVQRPEHRLELYVGNIEAAKRTMLELRDAAHVAQQADLTVKVDKAGAALTAINAEMDRRFAALNLSHELLASKMAILEDQNRRIQYAQSVRQVNAIIQALIPDIPTMSNELRVAANANKRLSPKDSWENNGILDVFSEWNEIETPTVLWICGQSGSRDSWVTQFSHDIIEAMSTQDLEITVVYCFFEWSSAGPLSATTFLRRAIARILEQRPSLVIDLPDIMNTRVLNSESDFAHYWAILEQMLAELSEVVFVIDRIDMARGSDDSTGIDKLLPKLLRLVRVHSKGMKIVLTSIEEPPGRYADDAQLSMVQLDTATRPAQREQR